MCINTNYNKIDDYHGSNNNFDDNDNVNNGKRSFQNR